MSTTPLGTTLAQAPVAFTVYRKVAEAIEVCPFGDRHTIGYYQAAQITTTEQTAGSAHVDADGQAYRLQPPRDAHELAAYVREDRARFTRRVTGLARDLDGRPLTERTPAGLPLATIEEMDSTVSLIPPGVGAR